MNTVEFLTKIWPEEGFYYVVTPFIASDGEQHGFAHYGHDTVESAAQHIAKLVASGSSVYYACASYITKEGIKDANGKNRKRVTENACKAKALWIDIDCGAEKAAVGKGYPTQTEACKAIVDFCKQVGIQLPILISSGYGIHAYWPLQCALTPSQWSNFATRLRAVLDFYGVKHDPSRTTDIASILRPVGALNHKRGEAAKVQAKYTKLDSVELKPFSAALDAVIAANGLTVHERNNKRTIANAGLNSDLMDEQDWPLGDMEKVAEKCAQIRAMRDTRGLMDEPTWHAALGVIKHSTDPEKYATEWSSGHPEYTEQATLAKMDQWTYPPTTCKAFQQRNCDGCAGCVYKDTNHIKSPIQLGWPDPVAVTQETVVDEATGEEVVEVIPTLPAELSLKYRWTANGLLASVYSEELKEYVWETISRSFVIPTGWVREGMAGSADKDGKTEDHHVMQVTMRRRPGVWENFAMPTSLLGSSGKLAEYLMGKAVTGDLKLMKNYLTDWVTHLSNEVQQSNNYTRFGWYDENFLCGDQMYKADGTVETVKIGGEALNKLHAFRPKGSLQEWIDVVDRAYNHNVNIQYQFLLCAGFGAPLFPMIGGANIPAAMLSSHSGNSAYGKSTAQRFALSIFCNPKEVEMSAKNVTDTALYIYLGIYHNLPVMVDEITNVDGQKVSDLSYTISQGRPKERGTQSGGLRHNNHSWSTLVLTSGNRSLVATLGAAKANAEAEIARIFECRFGDEAMHSKSEFDDIARVAQVNYGTAAEPYLKYLTTHREEVQDMLYRVQKMLDERTNARRVERFWSATAAAVLTGGIIARKLGLVKFDLQKLTDWICVQMLEQRKGMADNTQDDEETFAAMMADFASNLIVTDREGDSKGSKPPYVEVHPRAKPVGRVIANDGTLYLSIMAVRDWCNRFQADYSRIRRWLGENHYIKMADRQYTIGRGTQYPVPPTKCWVLDAKRLNTGEVQRPGLTVHTGTG